MKRSFSLVFIACAMIIFNGNNRADAGQARLRLNVPTVTMGPQYAPLVRQPPQQPRVYVPAAPPSSVVGRPVYTGPRSVVGRPVYTGTRSAVGRPVYTGQGVRRSGSTRVITTHGRKVHQERVFRDAHYLRNGKWVAAGYYWRTFQAQYQQEQNLEGSEDSSQETVPEGNVNDEYRFVVPLVPTGKDNDDFPMFVQAFWNSLASPRDSGTSADEVAIQIMLPNVPLRESSVWGNNDNGAVSVDDNGLVRRVWRYRTMQEALDTVRSQCASASLYPSTCGTVAVKGTQWAAAVYCNDGSKKRGRAAVGPTAAQAIENALSLQTNDSYSFTWSDCKLKSWTTGNGDWYKYSPPSD